MMKNTLNSAAKHDHYLDKAIFVVDDESIIVELLWKILSQVGYRRVHCFTNSTEAFEFLKFLTPDLILTDIHMPEVSGTFLAKLISECSQQSPIPLLAVTGDATERTKSLAIENGIFDIILKPINKQELLQKIANAFQWTETQRATNQLAEANFQHFEDAAQSNIASELSSIFFENVPIYPFDSDQ